MAFTFKSRTGAERIMSFLLLLLAGHALAQAQNPQNEVSYFSYSKGLSLVATDSLFQLNIRFRIQNRLALASPGNPGWRINEVEARVRRLRWRLDGFVYDHRLTYLLQLSFATGELDPDNSRAGAANILRDAMIYYHFSPRLAVGFGQAKLPGNRQRVISSGDLQLVDRSIVNATFNLDRDFGLQAFYHGHWGLARYVIRTSISSGEGRNIISSDAGLAYTARFEWLPFGAFQRNGDYFEGDLAREQKPKLSIGIGYQFNHRARRVGGQTGPFLDEPRDLRTWLLDGLLKYRGMSLSLEYLGRGTSNPLIVNSKNELQYVYTGSGINAQLSFFCWPRVELTGRYSRLLPEAAIRAYESGRTQSTLGVTYYLSGHRLKLQSDCTYQVRKTPSFLQQDDWQVRFQVELGI